MRISDEERHEIARKLRELPARVVYDMAITLHCLIWPPNITYTGIDQLFARLADLIDRPTCENAADPYDGGLFVCSECGERWELTCGSPADNHLCFCPRCGAEVLND